MTLAEAKASAAQWLTPAQAASIIGCDQQTLRVTARQYPERLGFPFLFIGNRMKIHREPFIRFIETGRTES